MFDNGSTIRAITIWWDINVEVIITVPINYECHFSKFNIVVKTFKLYKNFGKIILQDWKIFLQKIPLFDVTLCYKFRICLGSKESYQLQIEV